MPATKTLIIFGGGSHVQHLRSFQTDWMAGWDSGSHTMAYTFRRVDSNNWWSCLVGSLPCSSAKSGPLHTLAPKQRIFYHWKFHGGGKFLQLNFSGRGPRRLGEIPWNFLRLEPLPHGGGFLDWSVSFLFMGDGCRWTSREHLPGCISSGGLRFLLGSIWWAVSITLLTHPSNRNH